MLKLAGLETTLIIREKYFWDPLLDEASGRMIEAALKKGGVKIVYESQVAEVLGEGSVTGVKLNDGTTLETDMIIVGIGTKSTIDWVAKAGIGCNRGILANEYLQTSDPNIFTAGDVAEYGDTILNEHIQFGNWANAQVQGKIAATNMMGGHLAYHHVSFYSAQGLGTAIVFAGDVRVINNRSVVQRGSPEAGGYTRIIIQDGEVEGATMINRTLDLTALTKIIELDVKIEPYLKELADPAFDLKKLIPPTS
jgi:NAD(P)H-nitrite reductase large subunit